MVCNLVSFVFYTPHNGGQGPRCCGGCPGSGVPRLDNTTQNTRLQVLCVLLEKDVTVVLQIIAICKIEQRIIKINNLLF